MTHKEFTDRVLVNVSEEEYRHIEQVYLCSDLDKDEFCKLWIKMNKGRYEAAKAKREEAKRIASMPLIDYMTEEMLKKADAQGARSRSDLPSYETEKDCEKLRKKCMKATDITLYFLLRENGATVNEYLSHAYNAFNYAMDKCTLYKVHAYGTAYKVVIFTEINKK